MTLILIALLIENILDKLHLRLAQSSLQSFQVFFSDPFQFIQSGNTLRGGTTQPTSTGMDIGKDDGLSILYRVSPQK